MPQAITAILTAGAVCTNSMVLLFSYTQCDVQAITEILTTGAVCKITLALSETNKKPHRMQMQNFVSRFLRAVLVFTSN